MGRQYSLEIEYSRSEPGGDFNEDAIGSCGNAVWILDGATSVGDPCIDAPSDAQWYVRTFSKSLESGLLLNATLPTRDLLKQSITATAELFAKQNLRANPERHELPSAAFAMARILENKFELSALGDCNAIFRSQTGRIRQFADPALAQLEAELLDELVSQKRSGPGSDGVCARAQMAPQLRATRSKMNCPDGYWILSFDHDAVDHIACAAIDLEHALNRRVLLVSDGFARLWETFGAVQLDDFLVATTSLLLDDAFARLRELENADPECRQYPRFKRHDDATCVSVTVTEHQLN